MIIEREIEQELRDCAKEYPVITILGPRQSGKTILAKRVFDGREYSTLEDPDIREVASTDPRGYLRQLRSGAIIDEIQRVPELLSYIQGIVDEDDMPAQFVVTGSHQPELHEAVSQSLAGRTAILKLYPFSYREILRFDDEWSAFDLACCGMFPRIHDKQLRSDRYFAGYLQTYIERDVRALTNLKDLGRFQTFLRLLAGRVGQVSNYNSLSNDVGVSSTTIKNWIEVLKASFIVFELPPYFENIRKRVTKSPKLFFCDAGLLCYLLGIGTTEQLERDPLRGGIYENLVILEVLKLRANKGAEPDIFFYRDSHGNEVDLIIRADRLLYPVEIKSARTFNREFVQGIDRFAKTVGKRIGGAGKVCYNGEKQLYFKGADVLNPFLHGGFAGLMPDSG